jgi:transcriptional regulator with XRE-family HTH domain|nr:MAG TPA: Helix-turn-helix XRE-family like protein [Caudoviricetes sp.]DAY73185.1 MAG TPA: Helix-turn-helix XRE-family like protein [Caudoviricetes sp.]
MKEFLVNLINEERTKKKLSKSELAKRAGITLNQFRNIEAGRNTTIDSLDRILKALEVKRVNIKLV